MKRLASLVAFALLVPLSASASPSAHTRSSRHPAAKSEPAHAAAAPKPTAKPRHARAQTRGHADVGHHEPSVTRGVLVSKVSSRHVERPSADEGQGRRASHATKHDDKRPSVERPAKKPLPLLPAAALQRVDARELGEGAAKAAPRPGHERREHRGAKEDKTHAPKLAAPKLAPAKEGAKEGGCPKTAAERQPKAAARECLHDPVELVRGAELDRFALQRCEGGLAPLALERLSVALRPSQVARPVLDLRSTPRPGSLSKKAKSAHDAKAGKAEADKDVLPPQIKRVDPGLAERLDLIATHFQRPGRPVRVSVVSGYRPASAGSQHAHGRAMDIRVEGVENEQLVAFCKSIPDTGCGYYPNSSFVHVDVRDPGAGHVSWIDASGPGEAPRYVTEWPLKAAKPAAAEPPAVTGGDEHPAPPPPDEVAKEPSAPPADKTDPPKGAKPQELLDGVRD